MKTILVNAFSLQMLDLDAQHQVSIKPISLNEVKAALENEFESGVGHPDTANFLSDLLTTEVICNRIDISLDGETTLIVAQFVGGRLPAGATELPEGCELKFAKVTLAQKSDED